MYILNQLDKIDFCQSTSAVWQLIGYIFFVLKILVPLIIIILGVVDFAKAIISSKDDEVSNAAKHLGIRIIVGVAIFLVPSIIGAIFSLVSSDAVSESEGCRVCLTDPGSQKCKNHISKAKKARAGS